VGPSGSGKSDAAAHHGRWIQPQQGRVWLDGRVTAPRSSIGIVFQKANLMPWRTVRDNVGLPLEMEHLPSDEVQRRAQALTISSG
jgi:NitT/TauT family transport system ATP-binding protein